MSDIFKCYCGLRTREPFLVHGTMMCAVCAEQIAPALVARKAKTWAQMFGGSRKRRRQLWRDIDLDCE